MYLLHLHQKVKINYTLLLERKLMTEMWVVVFILSLQTALKSHASRRLARLIYFLVVNLHTFKALINTFPLLKDLGILISLLSCKTLSTKREVWRKVHEVVYCSLRKGTKRDSSIFMGLTGAGEE